MDTNTVVMIVVMIATGLYAGGTYALKKIQDSGEQFSWEKFLPTFGIGALSAIVLYFSTGSVPALDAVFTQIEQMMPGGAMSATAVLAAVLMIFNQLGKTQTAGTSTVSTPATQAATVEQAKSTLVSASAPTPVKTITATGPFYGHGSRVQLTGTRIIQAPGGAFQVINDDVSQNFIAGGAGENAIFSGEYSFSGNLTLITYGALY